MATISMFSDATSKMSRSISCTSTRLSTALEAITCFSLDRMGLALLPKSKPSKIRGNGMKALPTAFLKLGEGAVNRAASVRVEKSGGDSGY